MKGLVASTISLLYARTDEEAMCRVKLHDDDGEFARLMKRWEGPIRRLCSRMIGDTHRGEDLMQDTFLRLYEKRKSYEPKGKFSTFLWRIALNLCYDELRRQHRRREFFQEPEPGEGEAADLSEEASERPGPDLRTAQLEEGELVRQALLQLPEIYRTVLVLRHYEDLKLARIAEVLDVPEGTVNSRMAEALSRLSRLLEPKLKAKPQPQLRVMPDSSGPAPSDLSRKSSANRSHSVFGGGVGPSPGAATPDGLTVLEFSEQFRLARTLRPRTGAFRLLSPSLTEALPTVTHHPLPTTI